MEDSHITPTKDQPNSEGRVVARVRDVKKVYAGKGETSHVVLEDVNLDFYAGEIVAIVGRNAVGKSTLLRILAGLDLATDGKIEFMPSGDRKPTPRIGLAFQEVDEGLLSWRTNIRNIALGLEAMGIQSSEAKRKAENFVKHYDLPLPLNQYPGTSSGGQRQMVTLTRAALIKPQLLMLDEPLSKIDPSQIWQWRRFIMNYVTDHSPSCLIVTHNLDDAIYMADVVHVLAKEKDSQGARIRESFQVSVDRSRRSSWRSSSNYNELRQSIADAIELVT